MGFGLSVGLFMLYPMHFALCAMLLWGGRDYEDWKSIATLRNLDLFVIYPVDGLCNDE
jgi:hypothetical protein